jgi:CxxC motif-containing protein (DUF1111 family)
MKRVARSLVVLVLVWVGLGLGVVLAELVQQHARVMAGGEATVMVNDRGAFGRSLPTLSTERLIAFKLGDRLFRTNWVIAPASVSSLDGLGPIFNRVSCSACHLRDGRGQPPASPDDLMESMLVRLSVPGIGPHGAPLPEPTYGHQLQDRGVPGVPAEGRASVSYREAPGQFPDGEAYALRIPAYRFMDLAYGPLAPEVLFSPRVAPAVFGLGFIGAIPERDILALADPDDANGDGISGRANQVWDMTAGRRALGRFGWKANEPSLRQQAAGAAAGDIGLTSTLMPQTELSEAQAAARAQTLAGEQPELKDTQLDHLVFYLHTLAVPAARHANEPKVELGERVFNAIGCAACHVPSFTTGEVPDFPELGGQVIFPFSDLLLHDMGEGLADGRPDFLANGREWRTPPLWGIGLQQTVNQHTFFLHDGRARNLTEAILWHGGEGQASRDRFHALPPAERAALLRFLDSL